MSSKVMRRRRGACPPLIRGALAAVITTVALVSIFALIIAAFGMSDGAVKIVNQLIKLFSVAVGVRAAAKREDCPPLRGVLIGLIYMGVGVALYALLSGQRMTAVDYLIDLMTGVAAGGLSALLFGRKKAAK